MSNRVLSTSTCISSQRNRQIINVRKRGGWSENLRCKRCSGRSIKIAPILKWPINLQMKIRLGSLGTKIGGKYKDIRRVGDGKEDSLTRIEMRLEDNYDRVKKRMRLTKKGDIITHKDLGL